MSDTKSNIKEKLAKLDEIVAWFDSDEFELDAATQRFGEAQKLADEIEHDLVGLKNSITVLSERFDRDQEE